MEKKKVLMLASDDISASGAFRSMAKLCALLRDNYDVDPLIVVPYHGDGEQILDEYGLNHICIRSSDWIVPIQFQWTLYLRIKYAAKSVMNWMAVQKLKKLIRQNGIQVVHINTSYSYVGALAAKATDTKLVWHIREMLEEDQGNRFLKDNAISLIRQADAIIAISDYVLQKYEKKLEGCRFIRIYNGIDQKDYYFPMQEREYPTAERNTIRFLCVGNMSGGKGQDLIIEAVNQLVQQEITNLHVDFVGDGVMRRKYEEQIESYHLGQYFTFQGKQKDILSYYRKSDVMIMSSAAEAFGRTTVEAMMAGCMIIGSDSGATPELLQGGKYGMFYKVNDTADLSEKMKQVIMQPDLVAAYSEKAQTFALQTFTAQKNAENVAELYSNLLK